MVWHNLGKDVQHAQIQLKTCKKCLKCLFIIFLIVVIMMVLVQLTIKLFLDRRSTQKVNNYHLFVFYSDFPTSGNLITFLQFAFIALEGLVFTSKFGTVKSKIPVR